MRFQPSSREESGEENCNHTVEVGRRGADGNQGIHIGGFMPQRSPGALVESPACPELHWCRQHPEQVRLAQESGTEAQSHNQYADNSGEDKPVSCLPDFSLGCYADIF